MLMCGGLQLTNALNKWLINVLMSEYKKCYMLSCTAHLWSWPNAPWRRVLVNFAGLFLGSMFIIKVDDIVGGISYEEYYYCQDLRDTEEFVCKVCYTHLPFNSTGISPAGLF